MSETNQRTDRTSGDRERLGPAADGEERRPVGAPVNPFVYWTALGLILAFSIVGIVWTDAVGNLASAALDRLVGMFGWLYILAASGFVAFALFIAGSRYGRIPLGREDERPEFSTISWIAMMFAAGMGVGLIFYGAGEPIAHLTNPPPGTGANSGSVDAARASMRFTFFHWGVHPWGIYSIVGLALAYASYRRGWGNLFSSAFIPLLGQRANSRPGNVINIFAIVVTKFGSATSLGLATLQMAAGISIVFGVASSTLLQLLIILVLTVIFVFTAVSGVARGIKWLSNLNLGLAVVLALFLFAVGPTVFILNVGVRSVGDYLYNLLPMSFHTAAYGGGQAWLSTWTIFFWAWWISWALHVGTFLARVSRGRTVREFIGGVVLAPTLGSMVWFAILGGAAQHLQLTGQGNLDQAYQQQGVEGTLFATLAQYPLFTVTALVTIILVAVFFITGANAGALVLSILSSYGSTRPKASVVVVWGSLTGLVAAVLLLVGGLRAIETFVILAASPFVLVMIGLCFSLYKGMRDDPLRTQRPGPRGTRAERKMYEREAEAGRREIE